jgi:PPM family protein phosphatase
MLRQDSDATLLVRAAGLTDVGRVRDHNEDAILLRPDLELYVLADGAGGHNAGEVASALATRSIINFFEATAAAYRNRSEVDDFGFWTGARRLASAVHKANRDIIQIGRTSKIHDGMGTTVVALHVSTASGLLHLSHVGDSRCYRLRHGYLEQLTEDHSLVVDVLELRPEVDDLTLSRLPTNVITRALGMDPNVRVPIRTCELAPGDRYLLCSDGLSNKVSHAEIRDILGHHSDPSQIAGDLIHAANEAGGDDNIAAVVVICDRRPDSAEIATSSAFGAARTCPPSESAIALGREDSHPEIMLIGLEEVELDPSPIRVIPAECASSALLEAVEDLIRPLRTRASLRASPCPQCGEPVETPYCPACGARTHLTDDDSD